MSEVRNVNRIYDPSLEAELREAGLDQATEPQTAESFNRDKTGRIEIPPAFPFPPPTQEQLIAQELKEAGVEVEDDTQPAPEFRFKKLEEPQNLTLQDEVFQTQQAVLGTLKDRFDVLRAIPARDPDLQSFKKQVIEAFKHLGLDTQKFFGV